MSKKELTPQQVLAGIHKRLGKDSAMLVGQGSSVGLQAVCPTGLTVLDRHVLGCGGIPWGRVIEISGPEGGGKTSLANCILAGAQRDGALASLLEFEQSWEPEWAKGLGVNLDDLLFSQPSYLDAADEGKNAGAKDGESALAIIEAQIEEAKGRRIMFVLDSVAAVMTRKEFLDGATGDPGMAEQARIWSSALRKLVKLLSESQSTLVLVNQVRAKPGVMFGSNETTPGGNAIKFYATVRLRVNHGKSLDAKLARIVNVMCAKNKVAPPYRTGEFKLTYSTGRFDDRWSILTFAKSTGCIPERGGKLSEAIENLGWKDVVVQHDGAPEVEDAGAPDAEAQ